MRLGIGLKGSIFSLVGVLLLLAMVDCRARRRPVKVGATPQKLTVFLLNLEEPFNDDRTLLYETQCQGPDLVPGTFIEQGKIEFMVTGLEANDVCEMRISHPAPPSEIRFLQTPGVLYGGRFSIRLSASGGFEGNAPLGASFQLKQQDYTLEIPVRFKDVLPEDAHTLRSALSCESPGVAGASEALSDIDVQTKSGKFAFRAGLVPAKEYKCKSLNVLRGNDIVFYGAIDAGDQSIKVEPAKTIAFKKEIALESIDITTPKGLNVIIQKTAQCKSDEFFDLETRQCATKK